MLRGVIKAFECVQHNTILGLQLGGAFQTHGEACINYSVNAAAGHLG